MFEEGVGYAVELDFTVEGGNSGFLAEQILYTFVVVNKLAEEFGGNFPEILKISKR